MIRRFAYVQIHRGYMLGRLMYGGTTLRKSCDALMCENLASDNLAGVQKAMNGLLRELGAFRLGVIPPHLLIHLVPKVFGGYPVETLRFYRQAARKLGVSYPYLLGDQYGPLSERQIEKVFGRGGHASQAWAKIGGK